jgi:parallel beta-helix repeat protein
MFKIQNSKIKALSLTATLIFSSGFIFINITNAQEFLPPELKMPGTIKGEGVHFEIIDSQYLNTVLDSSEPIKLRMESIPEMLTMMIEKPSSTQANQTQITISNLPALITFYKYQDDYHNEIQFQTDQNGAYSFVQDLSEPHFVFIQPRKGTKFIKDDAAGGDCYLIGNWNASTKTCTLTQDVYETIQIDNNNITINGNSHQLTGNNTGLGIFLSSKTNVIINDVFIKNFSYGVYVASSTDSIIQNINSSNNNIGIWLDYLSGNNVLTNNATNFNQTGGIAIYSPNNTLLNNIASNNSVGIHINGPNNIITDNVALNNNNGISIAPTGNNVVSENTVLNNEIGIVVWSPNNVFKNNDIIKNSYGLYLLHFWNNQIYNNNFLNNSNQIYVYGGSGYVFNLAPPTGGNYWNDFDTPTEGCNDLNNDNFCDSPYIFYNKSWPHVAHQDSLPWIIQDGWKEPPLSYKAANLAKELVNRPEAYLWGGKGWDYNLAEFVSSANVLSGYTYWNPNRDGPNQGGFDTGIGVDCSGLITWTFNRAFDASTPAVNNFVKYVNANGLYSDYQSDAVAETDLLPGDAMFFDWDGDGYIDHTAMYVGESGGYDVVNAKNTQSGIIKEIKNSYRQEPGFLSFRRIHEGNVAMQITAGSPVDLTVTDPQGFTIAPDSIIPSDEEYIREIPGALYYLEMEQSSDGNPIDRVYSPVLKTGDYLISVIPEPGALATDTFSLFFTAGATTTILAENIPILDIPSQSYIVRSSEGEFEKIIPAQMEIKPETLNLVSKGVLTVFLQIEPGFGVSVNDIATSTIMLAGAKPIKTFLEMGDIINSSETDKKDKRQKDDNHKHKHKNDDNGEDEEGNEVLTLIAKFRVRDLINVPMGKNAPLLLTAQLFNGTKIEGSDTVRVMRRYHRND